MNSQILNEIIKLIIMIVTVVICKYIIPFIKTNVDFKKLVLIQSYASLVVNSAEKLYKHGDNDSKLAYATTLLSDMLSKININLSSDEIRAAIEEAVVDLKR